MEVAECSVAGIAGVELRRYLPSGLAGGVVKDEEAVGVGGCRNQGPWNGDCGGRRSFRDENESSASMTMGGGGGTVGDLVRCGLREARLGKVVGQLSTYQI